MDNNNDFLETIGWGVAGFLLGKWLYELFTKRKKK